MSERDIIHRRKERPRLGSSLGLYDVEIGLTFKIKVGVGRDHATSTACTVAVIAGDVEYSLLSF